MPFLLLLQVDCATKPIDKLFTDDESKVDAFDVEVVIVPAPRHPKNPLDTLQLRLGELLGAYDRQCNRKNTQLLVEGNCDLNAAVLGKLKREVQQVDHDLLQTDLIAVKAVGHTHGVRLNGEIDTIKSFYFLCAVFPEPNQLRCVMLDRRLFPCELKGQLAVLDVALVFEHLDEKTEGIAGAEDLIFLLELVFIDQLEVQHVVDRCR